MNKNKSIFTFSIIIFICLSLISTYFGGFYPYKDLSPISTSSSEINLSYLIDKLNNPKLNLSSNALSFSTSITLNENDLNNILMSVLKEYKDNINKTNLSNAYYHKIPFRGHMIFTPASGSNKIILHLDESKIGFISISKSTILSKISTNNIINVDMNNNEIILNLDKIPGVKIEDINISDNNLVITFQGEINIYEIINYIILHIK